MNNLDKIIAHIEADGNLAAEQIISQAKAECEQIIEKAKQEAVKIKEEAKKAAAQKETQIISAAQNSARQMQKQQALSAKQEAISKVLESAIVKLTELENEEYFKVLTKILNTYAYKNQKGLISFNEKDKERVPQSVYEGYGLSLSERVADIRGGLVLIYGEIEENCSFEALFDSRKEELTDKAAQMLFENGR